MRGKNVVCSFDYEHDKNYYYILAIVLLVKFKQNQ